MEPEFLPIVSKNIQISDFMKINTELLLGISRVVSTEVNTGKPRQFASQDRTVCTHES